MRKSTERYAGKHRKSATAPSAQGRIAVAFVTAGAVTTAGIGGAAAAQLDKQSEKPSASGSDFELAADAAAPLDTTDASPQILAISEFKPAPDLEEQLAKAIDYSQERQEADQANRVPEVAKPAEGTLTSPFGPRWGGFHYGIDIANSEGTPIKAVQDGTVIDSGPASGFGQWIRIQHEDGSISVYGHMSTLDVAVGEHVTAGQKIAGMGSMGFSTGTHLHFEIHPDGGAPVDPIPWLSQRGISV